MILHSLELGHWILFLVLPTSLFGLSWVDVENFLVPILIEFVLPHNNTELGLFSRPGKFIL